jgi:hypothetical protein
MASGDLTPSTIGGYVRVFILLAAAVAVMNAMISPALNDTVRRSVDEQVLLHPDGSGELSADGEIENFSANQTLGTAVELTGANDSELSGQASIPVSGNWTVTTWAKRDAAASGDRRVLQLDGWLYLTHNASAQQWRVTFYDEATLQVYSVTAAAPSPETWTMLSIERNATTLSVARNNTTAASVPIDGTGSGAVVDAENWDGELEETRVINETVTPIQRGRIYDQPTTPLEVDEVARIYYDGYANESSVDVYRTGEDLAMQNASFVVGFDGQPLVEDDVLDLAVDDYQRDGTTISTTSDGNLTGAPVVFVSYDGSFSGGGIGSGSGSEGVPGADLLLGLVLIAAVAVIIEGLITQ